MFELTEIQNQKVKTLSGGQRRRVDIARAIIHEPEFLILDEPTTGLDPNTRKKLWNIIRNLREKNGMTVFLTTHYMEEAADADFITIIEKGKIITEGTPLDLKNKYNKNIITKDEYEKMVLDDSRIYPAKLYIMTCSTNPITDEMKEEVRKRL